MGTESMLVCLQRPEEVERGRGQGHMAVGFADCREDRGFGQTSSPFRYIDSLFSILFHIPR